MDKHFPEMEGCYLSVQEFHDMYANCKDFFILYLNMHSLNKNFEKLEELLTQFNEMPDIIAVSKTKLFTTVTIRFFVMVFEIAYFMFKYCNKHLSEAFKGMLNKNTLLLSSKEFCQTRSKSNLFLLFCTIDLNIQTLSYRGPLIWNKISPTIRENKCFTSFKKQYHQQVFILE